MYVYILPPTATTTTTSSTTSTTSTTSTACAATTATTTTIPSDCSPQCQISECTVNSQNRQFTSKSCNYRGWQPGSMEAASL